MAHYLHGSSLPPPWARLPFQGTCRDARRSLGTYHGFAFCLPEAPASQIKGKITRQPALGIQLLLGLGKARYSSRLKCSQMTTKSSIPHHVTRCKEQLVLSQTSSLPVLSLSSREHTALHRCRNTDPCSCLSRSAPVRALHTNTQTFLQSQG